jgi:hypothetical protein
VKLAQSVAGTVRARIRSAVRPSVLVAVLLGLFLMHGGPASAAGGCHGGMRDTAVMPSGLRSGSGTGSSPAPAKAMATAHAAMASHPAEHSMAEDPADRPMAAHANATAHAYTGMPGALCVATTPRSEIPSPPVAAGALVFPVAVVLPWARRVSGGVRRRGPPGGGRELLLQVCIART